MARVAAIIPAAGAGARLGANGGKPWVPLCGEPMLMHTLRALQASSSIEAIVLAVQASDLDKTEALAKSSGISKSVSVCVGGASRAESVARGLAQAPKALDWILIHDAARPCVQGSTLDGSVEAATRHGAVACGLPASVTIKAVDARCDVRLTLEREHLWLVQTPQVFRRDWFVQALNRAGDQLQGYPDDAALLEAAGFPVRLIPGDPNNLKVTTPEDVALAEAILQKQKDKRAAYVG